VSYCDAGDHLCDTGMPMDPSVHPNYVNKYGDEVVDYFVRMYDAAKRRAAKRRGGTKARGWNATLPAK
jgi:hypothetical protein